jgi:hypothetical protein
MKEPFTDQEKIVWGFLVEAHNEFVKLPPGHPSDIHDWVTAIHQLQSILMCRVVSRDYPEVFTQPKK